jgi:hypothetical protein
MRMKAHRIVHVSLFLVTALSYGCTLRIGDGSKAFEDGGTTWSYGEAPRLPEPTTWHVAPPELTPEQAQRQAEVDQHLVERYRDYRIVETTQGYSGDLIDWVDSATIPGVLATPPPSPWTQADLTPSPGAELGRTELELYPELRGPEGTTPITRPDFSVYVMGQTGAASLQDYLDNGQVYGEPEDPSRRYAGLLSHLPNMGASGTINQFPGDVERGAFSIIEVAIQCQDTATPKTTEIIGAVVSRDLANFRDAKPRIHVEYLRLVGKTVVLGGWDHKVAGFVPYPNRPYGPGMEVTASAPGLGTQQEHHLDIYQAANGDWWIAHNGNVLGYYPNNLFLMLNGMACTAAWYGEVYDPTPEDWTWTDMGSGQFESAGYGYAAYVKDPKFHDLLFNPWDPVDDPSPLDTASMQRNVRECYTAIAVDGGCSSVGPLRVPRRPGR